MIQKLYKSLERPHTTKYGKIIQNVILLNVLINIFVSFAGDVFNLSSGIKNTFLIIEYVTVLFFVIELIARYISIGFDTRYKGLKGKILYTFTPFIIIDILTLIPYIFTNMDTGILLARVLRFFKFFRVLKLMRLKNTIRKFFSISNFSSSSIFYQFIVLFILSSLFITLFSFVYSGGEKISLMIFLDPPALADTSSPHEMIFGIIELIIGLFIGGALISIITELLTNISSDIKNGYYPYKGNNHIIIINQNTKLEFILNEIDYYYKDINQLQDIVLFLPFENNIENFGQNLTEYSNIKIFLIKGDLLNWNSYEKLNINSAKTLLILKEQENTIKYLDVKISKYLLSNQHFKNYKLEFIIESVNNRTTQVVYEEIFKNSTNKYNIIDHNTIIENFLNRSIIEPDYFKVYSTLLSFVDFEFYTLDMQNVFDKEIIFKNACMQFSNGILIGIIRNDELILNPTNELVISKNDKLITILKNNLDYLTNNYENTDIKPIRVEAPKLKTSRNICIVGNYADINEEQIIEFLTPKSIEDLKRIVLDNNDYIIDNFWDEIIVKNYDMIILDMEDDDEFLLTMYLRNKFKNNDRFLNSIVNIIHNPVNAKLLVDKKLNHNIIFSEKLVGEYITQVMFNGDIINIFDEITHSRGNEFYILEKSNYKSLFQMEYKDFKLTLLENNMLYIGAIVKDEVLINHSNLKESEKVIILAQGVD